MPHYTMVTFMRVPYAVALHRSDVQRKLLANATCGLHSLDSVDWGTLDAAIMTQLSPL